VLRRVVNLWKKLNWHADINNVGRVVQDGERSKVKHHLSIWAEHGEKMDSPAVCASCATPTLP